MNAVIFLLLAIALVAIDLPKGGLRMSGALPAYGVLALAAVLSAVRWRRVSFSGDLWSCLAASGLFFGYVLTRALFSPAEYLARADLYSVIAGLIVYFLTAFHFTQPKWRLAIVGVLLALGVANSAVGAIQFFEGKNFMIFDFFPRAFGYGSRASGFFGVPNHLAGFLEITVLMGVSLVWWGRASIYWKMVTGYGALMCLAGLMMTGSRGGYLSTVFGVLVFAAISALLVMERLHGKRALLIITMVVLALGATLGVRAVMSQNYLLQQRIASLSSGPQDVRYWLWGAAIKQAALSPVVGTGAGTYYYYGRQLRDPQVQNDPIYVHNDYLQLLAEYGLVGMATFLFFLAEHVRRGIARVRLVLAKKNRSFEPHSNSLALTIGALCAVGAHLCHAVVDFNLHIPANLVVIAFLFGVLANPGGDAPSRAVPEETAAFPLARFAAWVLPALGLWLGVIVFQKLPAEFYNEKANYLASRVTQMVSVEIADEIAAAARAGLAYDATNPELHLRLAQALMDRALVSEDSAEKERLNREAEIAAQRALDLAPLDRNLVILVAQCLERQDRAEEATAYYRRAVELDPNSATVRWNYGLNLQARGLVDQAVDQFEFAGKYGYWQAAERLKKLRETRPAPL